MADRPLGPDIRLWGHPPFTVLTVAQQARGARRHLLTALDDYSLILNPVDDEEPWSRSMSLWLDWLDSLSDEAWIGRPIAFTGWLDRPDPERS